MRRPKYRLSPNEVERLVKEDQEQRRKLRIIQVREQSKANAAVIRNDVRREKERLLNNFASSLKVQLEAEKEENIRKCEQKYEKTLRTIGEGHKEALMHGDGVDRTEKLQKQMQEKAAAEERFTQALERHRQQDSLKEFEKMKHILSRQAALLTEKQRAMGIASLPPPPPDICVELEKTKKRAIPMVDMKAFATTHYHIPDYQVVRAGSQEQLYNAKLQAQDSDLRLKQDLEDKARSEHAQLERARIRGNEALQKELLKHDYEDMLKDLSLLQKKDRRLRKKMLSQIPKQVFIPAEIYLEEKKEKQSEMERKFNEIYMDHLKMERDKQRQVGVSDQIVSHEFEAVSSPQTAAGLEDFSISMSRINPALRDLTNQPQTRTDAEVRKPDTVLKQLMNRIKEQRDESGTNQHLPLASETVSSTSVPTSSGAKGRPVSGEDTQNVAAAASKAVWLTTQDDSPRLEPGAASHTRKSHGRPVSDTNLQPDVCAMSESETMIECLRRRIELIQCQKEKLAQQLKAQVGVCAALGADTDGSSLEAGDEGWTLEEVDIDAVSGTDGHMQEVEQVNMLPVESAASNVGQGAAASAWQPPVGSGWGTSVSPHLMAGVGSGWGTSVSPHLMTGVGCGWGTDVSPHLMTGVGSGFTFGARRDFEVEQQVHSLPVDRGSLNSGPGKSAWKPFQSWDIPCGMRTAVRSGFTSGTRRDAGVQQEGQLLQGYGMSEAVKFGGVDSGSTRGDARQIWQNPCSFDRVTASSLGYGTMGSLSDDSASQGLVKFVRHGHEEKGNIGQGGRSVDDNADLMRKVQEYRERALERQASMDPETLGQVREYQHHLLQTYENKKKYLADIRADIEKRQKDLSAAASSKPAFSLESIQVKQFVTDRLGNATAHSQTVCADEKVVTSATGRSGVGGVSCNTMKDVEMFENSQTSVTTSLSAPNAVLEHKPGKGSGVENVCHKINSKYIVAGQGQEEIMSACQMGNSNSGGKPNIDKVRKSLSFDEEFMKSGNISWNDGTDADNSKCSQALTEDPKMVSSEEERGSPVLPQGHFELSDKSNTLPHDRAYMYGSTLLAQAQERKLGFEHRQMELQNQLLDIQRQKDAIMQAYFTGQTALQQREKTLISKMATASALLNEDSNGKQHEEVRAKLASIRSQIDTDARGRTIPQEGRSGNVSVDVDESKESRSNLAFSNTSCNEPAPQTDNLNESTDIDRTSSRQSLGNCSGPGNISSDSYLAEISFHKIRSDEDRSLPTSAFHVPVPSSASSFAGSTRSTSVSVSHQQPSQTWAAILRTSANSQHQYGGWQQHKLHDDSPVSQSVVNVQPSTDLHQQHITIPNHKDFQNSTTLAADVERGSNGHQYTSPSMAYGQTDHQPHELSTILEVDTPGSVSAVTSSRRLITLSEQSATSCDIMNSIPGQGWNLHRVHSGVRMDVFPDLPYTFQENRTASLGPGAVYHLQPGLKSDNTLGDRAAPSLRLDIPGGHKQTTAKRSLDFSDNLYVSNMPALVELTQYRTSDTQVQEVEGVDRDHVGIDRDHIDINRDHIDINRDHIDINRDHVDRTLGQDVSAGEDSSLKISGFSDYMRLEERSIGKTADESTGISALSTNFNSIDEGNCTASAGKAADRPVEVLSSLPHKHGFDPSIVERLQQQSRVVFGGGDDVKDSNRETSMVSLSCSSLSCDLEEVSIAGTDH